MAVHVMEVVGKIGEVGVVSSVVPADDALIVANQGVGVFAQSIVVVEVNKVTALQFKAHFGHQVMDRDHIGASFYEALYCASQ
ncbi:MAG: hypothetical protein DRI37_00265 [Chloroflexi bacterium]|nr:MAG: hypothetical protein DRI37_00265 [Chloroflexota bacterium]